VGNAAVKNIKYKTKEKYSVYKLTNRYISSITVHRVTTIFSELIVKFGGSIGNFDTRQIKV